MEKALAGRLAGLHLCRVPKIDWFDDNDDQPRWQPRARRERWPRDLRERRARLDQIIALAAQPPLTPEPPTRRPLHLIWGVPAPRTPEENP
jgi:hypothetical protein